MSSNNKKAKPKLTKHKILEAFQRMDVSEEEFIDDLVLDAHLGLNRESVAFVLNRLLPNYKATQEPIHFEITGTTLTEKAECILNGISNGEISVDQAAQLISSIGALGNLIEIEELRERLEALENGQNKQDTDQ